VTAIGFAARVRQAGPAAAVLNALAVDHVSANYTNGELPFDSLEPLLELLTTVGVPPGRQFTIGQFVPLPHVADETIDQLTAARMWLPTRHAWILADVVENARLRDRLRKRRVRGHVSADPPTPPRGVGLRFSSPTATATVQTALPLPLPEDRSCTGGGPRTVAWYAQRLKGSDSRTAAVIASCLTRFRLPEERALALAWESLGTARREGVPVAGDPERREPVQSEARYFVACLRRMGEEGLP
jgi:hypothetical protein